jgi:hypothetical protein
MSGLACTPSNHTPTIQDIVYLHDRILRCQSVLEDRPCNKEAENSIEEARVELEETLLVPAVNTFIVEAKDASDKLGDWTRVMDAMVALKKADPLKPEVQDARQDLKKLVKDLAVIVLALREKFYV